jgi:hypothetical protein
VGRGYSPRLAVIREQTHAIHSKGRDTFFKKPATAQSECDRAATFATPGLILRHNADGTPARLGLTFGAGQQIAVTHFHTYNHATVITARIPF